MTSKALIFSIVVMMSIVSCKNSNSGSATGGSDQATHIAVYERALKNQDDYTAMVALNYVLLNDTNNIRYSDSLSRLYMKNGLVEAGLNLAEKVVAAQPKNYKAMELVAEGQAITGNYADAVKNYNALYKENPDLRYLYQLAKIESNRNDMAAFNKRLDEILSADGTVKVEFPGAQGTQMIDIKAAVYFLKAQVFVNENNFSQAGNYLKQCLAIEPNFESALIGVEQLKEYQAMQSQGGGGTPKQLSPMDLKKLEEQKRYEDYINSQKK
ncbi:MAG: hypothetical protein GC181_01955 [Bacteroidetes bacterium]|nr:hypothetical protein [Bacteroidota bacterium]